MSSTPQQNALIVPSLHAPFELAKRAVPSPGPGQVLIKIMAVALNPMDWLKVEHDFLINEYPQVLGHDIAGVVQQLGGGGVLEGFKVGDRVFSQSLNGGFQQYTVLPAAALMHIPVSLSFDAAATFPITFPTACVGLFAPAPIGAALNPTFSWDKPHQGESALVLGGSTSTGQFAIQLFKFLGYTQIVVYASKKHFDFLRQLGATECIDRAVVSTDALPTSEAITSLSPPLKVVYDAVGNLETAYDCVVDGGRAITVHPMAPLNREGKTVQVTRVQGYYVGPDVMSFKPTGNVQGYHAVPEHTTFGKLIIKNLPEMIEKGVVTPNRLEVLSGGLSGIPAGLERLKLGAVSGIKLVAHRTINQLA